MGVRLSTRRRLARYGLAGLAALGSVAAMSQLPLASAAFTDTATNSSNSFAAASSWCTSPGSITRTVTNDAMVVENNPSGNYGTTFPLDVQARTGQARRMMVRPTLPSVPSGCTVTAATLTLTTTDYRANRTIEAQRLTSTWDINSLTWNNQPAPAGTITSADSDQPTFSIDVTAQIQALIASGNNHGIVLRDSDEDTAATFTNSFDALDGTDPGRVAYTWG